MNNLSRLYYFSSLFLLLASQFDSSTAAALRATLSPADDDNDNESKPKALTAKLSSSSRRHRSRPVSGKDDQDGQEENTSLPLVGIGVGNSPHPKIPFILASALSPNSYSINKQKENVDDLHYRMIDTSHTDSLEVLVGRSLSRLLSSGSKTNAHPSGTTDGNIFHILIKINHTHLGYERTMLSVQNSLSDILPSFNNKSGISSSSSEADFRVHAIIQYPRCYDSFFTSPTYKNSPNFPTKHSSCHEEEEALDEATKAAGSSPLLDKEDAWRRSWRALEELYRHGTLESIGVSNFGPFDMKGLFEISTVGPHIYQGTLRSLLLEEDMIEDLVRHGVHYQCIDAVSTILTGKENAPKAYATLERIGAKQRSVNGSISDGYGYSAVQIVLGWLVQRGVGVSPSTTSPAHLAENSPIVLASMPKFSPRENLDIETALLAIISGEDSIYDDNGRTSIGDGDSPATENVEVTANGNQLDGGVVATFFNTLHRNIRIFQVHPETGRQIQLSQSIPPGRSGRLIVRPADVLIAYDGHGVAVKKFLVEGFNDGRMDFSME